MHDHLVKTSILQKMASLAPLGIYLVAKEICLKTTKKIEFFCNSESKIEKISWFSLKSYGFGERIRIRKDPSIFTDPDPFDQKSTGPDPDPRNPGLNRLDNKEQVYTVPTEKLYNSCQILLQMVQNHSSKILNML